MTGDLRGKAAAVGIGLAGIGAAPGYSHLDLTAQAVKIALDDAGLRPSDVDGLFAGEQRPARVDRLLGRLVLADGEKRGTFFAFQGLRTD